MGYLTTNEVFKGANVDWTSVPSLQELESHIAIRLGLIESEKTAAAMRLKDQRVLSLNRDDYVLHGLKELDQLQKVYEDNGFETKWILQDPFGHKSPTAACPIGFPFNLPIPSARVQLRRFNRWICRIHVEIANVDNCLVSVPHIEPDPAFHKIAHIWDTYIKKRVVMGKEAVRILEFLGISGT
jgi:hypothetical protein